MSLKSTIIDKIVNPISHSKATATTVAKVTKSDEINNSCSINYIDKDGFMRNKDNVSIRIYGNGSDWFPVIDDYVIIEDNEDFIIVSARYIGNFNVDVRSKMKLQKDIYEDSCGGGSIGGVIF